MKKDIKRQIKNLQAKRRRTELLDECIKLQKQINELKRQLKTI